MNDLENKKFLFLGDSITQGIGASSIDKCFVSQFALLSKSKVVNYGVGGTSIGIQKGDFEFKEWSYNFINRVDEMDNEADYIVVFGGTNDFGHSDYPMGSLGDKTPESFYGAVYFLLEKLIKKYPMARIILLTPLHRLSEDNIVNELGFNSFPLKKFVEAEKEVAEIFSIPVLDLWANSGMQPKIDILKEKFMPDGLHPNDLGHLRIAQMLYSFILSNFNFYI